MYAPKGQPRGLNLCQRIVLNESYNIKEKFKKSITTVIMLAISYFFSLIELFGIVFKGLNDLLRLNQYNRGCTLVQ